MITTMPGFAQVEMSKTAPATVIAGNDITYTIQVNATNTFTSASLSDPLPAGTTFVSLNVVVAPVGAGSWNCTTPAAGSGGAVNCTKSSMALGETATFTITARVCSETACDTLLDNSATLTFGATGGTSVARTARTTVQSQSDLSINTSVAPASAMAGDNVTYTLTVANLGKSNSANTIVTNMLPPGFTAVSATPSLGICSGIGTGTVTCNIGTLSAAGQCAGAGQAPTSATIAILAHVPSVSSPGVFSNTATVAGGNCLPDPVGGNNSSTTNVTVNQTLPGPGSFYRSNTEISTQKPGSVLFFGFYISAPGDPNSTNTRINITNVHPTQGVVLHLFFVDGQSCSVADAFLCLTANQTHSFLMSDVDPGTSGYVMAIAVDGPPGFAEGRNTGCPISFNFLIGNANIKLATSPMREADLAAESVASEFGSPLPTCDPNSPTATLPFNGTAAGYNRLPRVLAASNIPSRADGNDTLLVLTRIGGNLATGAATLGPIFGILYDDAENPYSFSFSSGACQFRSPLSSTFPRTTPRFESIIPAGRSGWMKLWGANDIGIIGATLNRNDNKRTAANAFEGGHMLHKLTLTNSVTVTIPIFPPSC
jgi:uncharacterized repeat protein (TIGR01451 family)